MSATHDPDRAAQDAARFGTDEQLAARVRAVAAELRGIASRRRALELAAELDAVARILEPDAAA